MLTGVVKEIKPKENRVAMTPAGVEQMKSHGHSVPVSYTHLTLPTSDLV